MFACFALASSAVAAVDFTEFVDTKIGGSYRGHTFPGAACPFGMVQASPDTGLCDWDHCSGYVWEDQCIYGFSQTHLSGTGCTDLADVRLLPFVDDFDSPDPRTWRLAKDFRTERGRPGFYTVALTNAGVNVELTATPCVGVHRYTYAPGKPVKLLVDFQWANVGRMATSVVAFSNRFDAANAALIGGRRVHAWLRRSVCWKIVFDRPWKGARLLPKADPRELAERWVLEFEPGAPLVVKAAVSTVDEDGAAKNYAAEADGRSFDEIREATRAKWQELLGRFEIPGASAGQRTAFYTALYHLFIQPNNIADVDGRYRGGDAKVAAAKDGVYYTGLSLWDTFRAAHPFYTIAVPERVDGFVNSMLGHYRALGFLPVIPYFGWESHCMIGNHSVPVIVDAYKKGFRGFDVDLAFEAVTNSLTVMHTDPFGRQKIKENWDLYDRHGYYPFDEIKGESVSRTLECSFDDWCAAEFCRDLGRGDEAFFRKRANYWRNVFDREAGFMRGRDASGKWRTPYDPFHIGHGGDTPNDFTEGNAFQYTWHVLQDPQGLIEAMGGRAAFLNKLDSLFVQPERTDGMGFVPDVTGLIGQYAHGNEPSHHVAYFYTLAGKPSRTAEVVREVCDRFYGVKAGDLCGNDDCGQMSAWYVFAAMGFYPCNPCGGEYIIGAPQLPRVECKVKSVTCKVEDERVFTVIAKNLSKENKYVKSVTLNGKPVTDWKIRHADIMAGGELVFEMCDKVSLSCSANAERTGKTMFLGDSITHGGYCLYYLQLLENLRHPGSAVRYYNAGYSGGTVATGLDRLRLEMERIQPDRVFVMFGMNDARWNEYATDTVFSSHRREAADKALSVYGKGLTTLAERILSGGSRNLVLMTPTPYDEYSSVLGRRRRFVNEYGLSSAASIVRKVAAAKKARVVDLNRIMTRHCQENPTRRLCGDDGVHPKRPGHLLMAFAIWQELESDDPVACVTLDANGNVVRAENAAIDNVAVADEMISFDYSPSALPFPRCPEYKESVEVNCDLERFNREMLVVVGSKSGNWTLFADGREIGSFSDSDLSRGVNLAELDTPNSRLAGEALSAAYELHDFDASRRDCACVRRRFENCGIDWADKAKLTEYNERHLAKLKEDKRPWHEWEEKASSLFLSRIGHEAELAEEEARRYAKIAAVRPKTCRFELKHSKQRRSNQ